MHAVFSLAQPDAEDHAPLRHGDADGRAAADRTLKTNSADERASASDSLDVRLARTRDPWLRAASFTPLVAVALYLALALRTLSVSHPMEDAYILFHYVENFVAGHGIVFNVGGPRAEGATDFLWFLAISLFVKLGFNVAIAAAVLNALGAGLASFVCVRLARASGCRGRWALVLAIFSLVVALSGGALAGFFGFSSMLYGALALLAFAAAIAPSARTLPWIPWFALVLGLFRPDGVILGVAYALIGFAAAWRANALSSYLRHAVGALVVGAAYFVWRYAYFGLLLPLPLYVKEGARAIDLATAVSSPSDRFLGLEASLVWLTSNLGPIAFAACALLLAFASGSPLKKFRTLAIALVPSALLFLALCMVRQTQNFGFRFEAPLEIAMFGAAFWLLAQTCASSRPTIVRAAACAAFAAASWSVVSPSMARLAGVSRLHTYMDVFPSMLARVLHPGRTIALTDAGRIPYWTDARVEDVIGLNSPVFALAPPTLADLEAMNPDIVMFNTAQVFSLPGTVDDARAVLPLTREELRAAVVPACKAAFDGAPPPPGLYSIRENVAALSLGRLLDSQSKYDLYAVAFGSAYAHVWGFKRDLAELPQILDAMRRASMRSEYRAYLELIRAAQR